MIPHRVANQPVLNAGGRLPVDLSKMPVLRAQTGNIQIRFGNSNKKWHLDGKKTFELFFRIKELFIHS